MRPPSERSRAYSDIRSRDAGTSPRLVLALVLACLGTPPALSQTPAPEELYAESVSMIESGDLPGAILGLRRVLEIDPEHIPSWFNLALALGNSGDAPGAIEAYRSVVALDPTLFEARMNLAIALQETGQTREALAEATEGTTLRPDDPAPLLFRAELLDQLDEFEPAERAYRSVLALDPTRTLVHRRLGNLYRRTGRVDEAYQAFTAATLQGADDAVVFISLGDIAVDRGDLEDARDHYSRALEEDSADDEVRLRLALVLNELGNYAEAIPLLSLLEGVEPILAETFLLAGEFDRAAGLYQSLAMAEPDDVGYWLGLGRSYYELKRMDAAVPALERAIRIDPRREQALGMLAAIYHESEDYVNAATILLRLVELRPDDELSHFLLATAYDNLENAEQALLHYRTFLELDDGSNDARTFQVQQRAEFLEKVLD